MIEYRPLFGPGEEYAQLARDTGIPETELARKHQETAMTWRRGSRDTELGIACLLRRRKGRNLQFTLYESAAMIAAERMEWSLFFDSGAYA